MTVPAQEPQDLASQLLQSGAHPVEDNADDLLRRMQELEAKYQALATQQGVVTDPLGHARKNLVDHLRAHAAANPSHAEQFNSAADTANDEYTNPDLVSVLIADLVATTRADLSYVAQLERDWRKVMAS